MKKEHEKLKKICDLIGHEEDCIKYAEGYEPRRKGEFGYEGEFYVNYTRNNEVDVREIIFTPEFNNKMLDYLQKNESLENKMTYALGLMNNLYNPVQYLYKIILLGEKQKKKL